LDELSADFRAFALVEGAVAAGGQAALLGVELGQGTHAAAADAGEMQPGVGAGAGRLVR